MGAWGAGLYDNDFASDVRGTYRELLQDGASNAEAYDKTFAMYQDCIGDEDEEPIFWYALAETQWRLGRLMPEVEKKAMEWIGNNGGAELWEDSEYGRTDWLKTLSKLKATLQKPMPPEKKIRKPTVINQNLWNIGDVYAYQFHQEYAKERGLDGKYFLIQKIGEDQHVSRYLSVDEDLTKLPFLMRIHVFDKMFDHMPTIKDMKGVRILPIGHPDKAGFLFMNTFMTLLSKKEYPQKYLTFLGNTEIPANKPVDIHSDPVLWFNIESRFNYCYTLWQGREYETVEEGVFRCNFDEYIRHRDLLG